MTAHLLGEHEFLDPDRPRDDPGRWVRKMPGVYEVERVDSPRGDPDPPWYVFKGTRVGMTVAYWESWSVWEWPLIGIIVTEEAP